MVICREGSYLGYFVLAEVICCAHIDMDEEWWESAEHRGVAEDCGVEVVA